jgi:hypothetical protein
MNLGHSAKKLPDPWLFDSELLLRELAKIREAVLRIPVNENSHSDINAVIDRVWRLEGNLKFLLQLHAEGQRRFQEKALPPPEILRTIERTNKRLADVIANLPAAAAENEQ